MEERTDQIVAQSKMYNQYNLLQLRLDSSNILDQVKLYINSEVEIISEDDMGEFKRKVIPIGIPKANKRGQAAILNWIQMIINPQVVQGNFPVSKEGQSPMYDMYIEECQKDLGDLLMINLYNYDIDEAEWQGMIDSIMNIIKPFMTRLIGNKERESYGDTFREISSTNIRDKGKVPFSN